MDLPAVTSSTVFRLAATGDIPLIKALHDTAFGPGRFARTAFRIREMAPSDLNLSIVALVDGRLLGAVMQSPIAIGGEPGIWLGPIAVTESGRRAGLGAALMTRAIARTAESGARYSLLVGDRAYYQRFGYRPVEPGTILLPGPVDPARLLGLAVTALPILPKGRVAARTRETVPQPVSHSHHAD